MKNCKKFTGSIEIYEAFGILPNKLNKIDKLIPKYHRNIFKSGLVAGARIYDEKKQYSFIATEEYMEELLQKENEDLVDMAQSVNNELMKQFDGALELKAPSHVRPKKRNISGLPDKEPCFIIGEESGSIGLKSQERSSFEEFANYEGLRENLGEKVYNNEFFENRNRFILKPFCIQTPDESVKYIFPIIDLFSNGMGIFRCSIPIENQPFCYIEDNHAFDMISAVILPEKLKENNDFSINLYDAISKYMKQICEIIKTNVLCTDSLTNIIISKSDYGIDTFNDMDIEIKKDFLKLIYAPYNHVSKLDEDTKSFFDENVFGKDFLRILVSSAGRCISLCEEGRSFVKNEEKLLDEEKVKSRICSAAYYIEQAVYVCLLNKYNLRKTYNLLHMSHKMVETLRLYRDDEDYISELYEGSYGSAMELIQFMREKMSFFLNEDVYLRKIQNSEKNITQEKEERMGNIASRFNLIAIIFTVFFGLPIIQDTIRILKCKIFYGYVDDFSFWIWIALIAVVFSSIIKHRRK